MTGVSENNRKPVASGRHQMQNEHKCRFMLISPSAPAAARFLVEHQTELEAELCRRELSEFVKAAWPIIEPGTEYLPNWHIDLQCEYLTLAAHREITRLALEDPPRHMKSTLVSVMWPCWVWTWNPMARFLFAAHSMGLSTKHSLDRRAILQSDWYRTHWPSVQLADDNNLKTVFGNNEQGIMRAQAVGAGTTGFGGDYIVADDLVSAIHGDSRTWREGANTFFDRALYNRLDDKKHGVIVVIMQRLHCDDLIGHIEKTQQEHWTFVKIPAIATKDEDIRFPISGHIVHRHTGDILWPEREGAEELRAERERLGSYGFSAQYQQEPVPMEGALAKREWFKIVPEAPAGIRRLVRYWDLAATEPKPGRDPDYTASCLMGQLDGVFYILHMTHARLSPLHVEDSIRQCAALDSEYAEAHRARYSISIEQEPGSSGVNTIDHYARQVLVGFDFSGERVTGDKFERGRPFLAACEAGNVCCVNGPWVQEYLDEMSTLGVGDHDDLYDSADGAYQKLVAKPRSSGGWNA